MSCIKIIRKRFVPFQASHFGKRLPLIQYYYRHSFCCRCIKARPILVTRLCAHRLNSGNMPKTIDWTQNTLPAHHHSTRNNDDNVSHHNDIHALETPVDIQGEIDSHFDF